MEQYLQVTRLFCYKGSSLLSQAESTDFFPLSISVSIHPYCPSLPAGIPNYMLCLHRGDVIKFLLVSQHWHFHVRVSIEER